jgi:glycosyltransferase involved in cell wall biosynthesis
MDSLDSNGKSEQSSPTVCFLGNFPPKECGIATFTKDLTSAMNEKFNPRLESKIVALNEDANIYNYNEKVVMEINRDDIDDYIMTAKEINESDKIRLVCIQHEFGIFGGEYGNHLLPFLELIEKPVVVTFHSVLPVPNVALKRMVESIVDKSSAVVVMANKAIDILKRDYDVDANKLFFIPHGIPNVPFVPSDSYKSKFGFEDKTVLSTFGLLGRGKGIEYVLRALPKLVEKHPNLLYLIIGQTHPNLVREEGETYRRELIDEIDRLGLKKHVKFCNRFLSLDELKEYLLATDVYVCTNLDVNQIVSGTLSYAMGCGRVVVSTPIEYAKEFLSQNRGLVVEEKSPDSYFREIDRVLTDDGLKKTIERNAYVYGRSMIWPNVAIGYLKVFNRVVNLRDETIEKFPAIKLNHLKNMTDNFGMLQFANHSEPDVSSGYTIDDNSRALIASVLHHRIFENEDSLDLANIYLNFIEHCQNDEGWFKNIVNKYSDFEDDSDDAFGRTVWALGYTIGKSKIRCLRDKSERLLNNSLGILDAIKSPRAVAFSMIGLCHYYKNSPRREILILIRKLADFLIGLYDVSSSDDWHWFEEILSYSNSKLPEALYLAYDIVGDKRYLDVAEKTLGFLSELTFIDGKICLIGQNGWCKKNEKRALFDQQPVDASSLVHTYLTAHSITDNNDYYKKAVLALNWFFGKNHLNQMVYDEMTGGCFDGVGKYSLNMNQGAESTLAYLTARLYLEEVKKGLV